MDGRATIRTLSCNRSNEKSVRIGLLQNSIPIRWRYSDVVSLSPTDAACFPCLRPANRARKFYFFLGAKVGRAVLRPPPGAQRSARPATFPPAAFHFLCSRFASTTQKLTL